ncbi:isopeptide-forming domain-containing fimbrial protein [Variovorax robiniae]|uniref:Isopeptide-forming domain-containing fimbrial protein n=1 Tax=Variovorax robiniae TaxID=1836199 RepID=A0ABU8X9I4_9BURK
MKHKSIAAEKAEPGTRGALQRTWASPRAGVAGTAAAASPSFPKSQAHSHGLLRTLFLLILLACLGLAGRPALAQASVSNTATIAPPPGVQDPVGGCDKANPPNCTGNNTSTSNVGVSAVVVAKTVVPASGSPVVVGQTVTYTLKATVTGAALGKPTVLTDTLGAGLTFGTVTSPGAFTAGGTGNTRTFTLPAGTVAGTYAVTYTATVDATATGSVRNSVVGGSNCTAAAPCTTNNPLGAVTLTKALATESGTQAGIAEAGETLGYTITIANPTAVAVSNYALTDTLSAGLSFVSADNGGTNAGQTTNWTGLTIPAGGSLVVKVSAKVNTPVTTANVTNIAKPTGSPDPACPSSGCVVTPTSSVITAAKTANPATGSTVVPGQTISYTLTTTITGSATATSTVLTDALGTGLTFGSVTNAGAYTAGGSGNARTFTLPAGTVAGTYAVTYTATVDATATGTVKNGVTGTSNCTIDAPCSTNHTIGAVTLTKALATESGTQAGIAEAGETLGYTITIANPSAVAVTNYALTDTLSAGLTFVSADNGGTNAGQTTTWTGLTIPAGGSLVVKVSAKVNTPVTTANVTNIAKPTGSPDPACPSSACVVTPTASVVTLVKTLAAESGTQAGIAEAGETLTYAITLKNTGGTAATNYALTDTLSSGLSFVSADNGGTNAGPATTWTGLTIPAGGTLVVTVKATVNTPVATATVSNIAKPTGQPDPACPSDGCVVTPTASVVTLNKTLVAESGTQAGIAEAGETLTYAITLKNTGGTPATNYALTDTLSAGLTFVSADNGGTNAGQSTTWTGLTIPAGGTLVVTVKATVNTPITSASVNNLAKPTGSPDPGCPSAGCVVTPTASVITVAKTSNPASGSTVVPGQTLSYTLTATITGSATAEPTVLTDTLGTGLTFGSVTTAGAYTAGGAGSTRTFSLPAGTVAGVYAVTYTVTVDATATGAVKNSVVGGSNCTAAAPCTTNNPLGAVTVTKALATESGTQAGIAEAGETLGYAITITNPSAIAVSNFALTDTLSAGLTFVSASNGGVNAGQTTNWTGLTIPANGTLVVNLKATVNTPVASANVSNLAKPTGQPDPACPSAACVVTPTASVVTLVKTLAAESGTQPGIAEAGETLTCAITLKNSGGTAATNYALTDTLSAGLTFVSASNGGVNAGPTTSWTGLTVPAGGTLVVIVKATVNTPIASANVTNIAKPTGTPDPACPSDGCVVTPTAGVVSITKALTAESGTQPGIAEAGETLTYSITLKNTGGTAATNYALADTLSAGLTFVSADNGGVNAGQATNWTGLTVPAGGTLVVTVKATVNTPITSANVTNIAKPTGQPDPACPSATCVVTPTASVVSIVKALTAESGTQPGIAEAGETLTYSITLKNTGGTAATNYALTDTLSSGLTFVSADNGGKNAGQATTWTGLTVPAGGTLVVTVKATVNAPISTANVTNIAKPTGSPDPACPSDGCVVTPTAGAISIVKAVAAESGTQAGIAEAGETLTYSITLRNTGGTAVTNYALTDTLSAGLTFASASNGGANAGPTTNWTGLTIPAGGTLVVTLKATVNTPITTASVTNIAKPTGQPDPACPSDGCVVTPTSSAVTLVKTLVAETGTQPGVAEAGETLTYNITLKNSGGTAATNYALTDTLGTGLSFASASNGGVNAGQSITWTGLAIPAGGTLVVTVKATVNTPITTPSVANIAKPTGTPDPACPSNGCVVTPTTSVVTVAKTAVPASGATVIPGQTISYTLKATVTGSETKAATVLTDKLGAGLTFVSVTSKSPLFTEGGSGNQRTFTLPAGTVAGTYEVVYKVTVDVGATGTVNNAVTGANCTVDKPCTTSHPVGKAGVSKQLVAESGTVPGVAEAGETLTYRITISNPSTAPITGFALTDTMSTGLTFVSADNGGVNAGLNTTWTGLTIPASGTLDVTVKATVNTPIATTSVSNLAKQTGEPDPACPGTACVVTPTASMVTLAKKLTAESGKLPGIAEAGESLTYSITLTNTGGTAASNYSLTDVLSAGLSYVSSSNGGANQGQTTTWTGLNVPANGALTVTIVARVNTPITTAMVTNIVKPTGATDPACPSATCVQTPTGAFVTPLKQLTGETGKQPRVAEAGEQLTYTITFTNSGGTAFANYRFTENVPAGATLTSVSGASGFGGPVAGVGSVNLTVPNIAAGSNAVVTVVFKMANEIPAGVTNLLNLINGGDIDPACGNACSVSIPVENPAQLSIVKTSAVRVAKIGDLVRYTLTVSNVGASAVTDARIVDTPPQGFTYVTGSVAVADGDGAFTVGNSVYPLQIGGIDIAVGKQATITYLLRVGAGVRQGVFTNQAVAQNLFGRNISNVATADVDVTGDPLVDDSLILGTVFDDRDGDGWQDPASLSNVRVQGGFAPGAYIANSTTVDRGQGPRPEPDASSPMLHGIALGTITGRQTEADLPDNHKVVIRQRLNAPSFTDDFVLTNSEGVTVRMDASGKTTVEKSGDAAKGLNGAEPTVERVVTKVEGGYVVDYIVRNAGIDERGIPGVRIASVEGLIMETDQFGRYNLVGINGGDTNRGRNFILKVDPSTLPEGATFTTANPLVRRITPGLPVRFDFGVKLPTQKLNAPATVSDIELGEVLFAPNSTAVRKENLPVIEKLAAKVNEYGGGELVISANGEAQGLALGRAQAVEAALKPMLNPAAAKATRITARTVLTQPATTVVGVSQDVILLGTVLFDTDKADITPSFKAVIAQVAKSLEARKGGVIGIVGHADIRASDAHNVALGLRRAKAVYDALVQDLSPEMRTQVRVETVPESQPVLRGATK